MNGLSLLKKIIAILLVAVIAAGLASCAKTPDNNDDTVDNQEVINLTVPYHAESGLNPFTISDSLNVRLMSLMHRGLYYLDTDYSVVNDLAADQAVTGATVEVVLKEAVFCDGISITAEDVVYSFEKAKASVFYGGVLSDVNKCEVKNPTTVVFTLSDRNINATMKLTFPIVRSGTAEKETSKPSGAGPFMFSVSCLVVNPYYGETAQAVQINLRNVENDEIPTHLLDDGEIDFCYTDLSGGETIQCSSPGVPVYLNNLVYIGLNGGYDLGATNLRKAISAALDRRTIADSALQGNARPAGVPFNTSWVSYSATATAKTVSDIADKATAVKLLKTLGIGEKNTETGEYIKEHLTLIYPDSNSYMFQVAKLIQTQLGEVNIEVTVKSVPSEEYLETIQGTAWDMYIGEISIHEDMDITQLMSTYGNAAYGISYYLMDCDEAYTDYVQGDCTMDYFLEKFLADQPFIPLAYRNDRFYYSADAANVGVVTQSRLFGDIYSWLTPADTETTAQTETETAE